MNEPGIYKGEHLCGICEFKPHNCRGKFITVSDSELHPNYLVSDMGSVILCDKYKRKEKSNEQE